MIRSLNAVRFNSGKIDMIFPPALVYAERRDEDIGPTTFTVVVAHLTKVWKMTLFLNLTI